MDSGLKSKVRELLRQNILVSPEYLEAIEKSVPKADSSVLVLNKDVEGLLGHENINWQELDRLKVASEKKHDPLAFSSFLESISKPVPVPDVSPVKVLVSYSEQPVKRTVSDFVGYYSARFASIQSILSQRSEVSGLMQIARAKSAALQSSSIIGMVRDKQETKNGNFVLTLEDASGSVNVIVNKSRREIFGLAQDLVFDEVIAVSGNFRNGAMFASNIVLPDIPLREKKHSPNEGYAVFMSDLHFGSARFLDDDFKRFLKWINGSLGSPEQREIASKVKYVIVAGDVVDGVGVYQDQYDELAVKDVIAQYQMCYDYLSQIPSHIKIIISPGNHDAVRAAEPQAAFSSDFSAPLLQLKNAVLVSNPALINIDSSEGFSGFDILIYHGYSFDYYVANVDSIRRQGGYERADLIMSFLLQRRHLAPAHTSTLILPDSHSDPLFIDVVPDIFATGHIHRTSVSEYKGVSLINSSCWQGLTKFQERMGHTPQPSRVPVMNLKTRATKIINFGK